MNVKITTEELLQRLSDIQGIVSRKSTMPILGYFLLSVGEENYIIATDLDTAIKEPIEISEVKEGGQLCIPAKKLYEIVREVEGEIIFSSEDKWLRLTANKSTFKLVCMSSDDYPRWPQISEEKTFYVKSHSLNEMISKTLYAAGESDTRYTLNSLLFHIKPISKNSSIFTIVGTDGHRLSMVKKEFSFSIDEDIKLIVPKKSANELKRFLDSEEETVHISFSINHISVVIGKVNFLIRLLEGSYPDYEQVIPNKNEKKIVIYREEFIKVLRRVSVISKDISSAVRIKISKGKMIFTSSNPDIGEAKDEIEIEYKGEDETYGFNARYLLEALNSMSSERVIFELQSPKNASLLKEEGKEDYLCVIMPMRI